MKTQTKQWFLYGTLFAALGFSVSGTDNKIDGSAHFSSLKVVKTSAEADAELEAKRQAILAARAKAGTTAANTNAPAAAAKPANNAPPTQLEEGSAPKLPTVTPSSATVQTSPQALTAPTVSPAVAAVKPRGNGGESSNGGRTSKARPAFEDYTVNVDGKDHTYRIEVVMSDGRAIALYSEKHEGSDCKDECGKQPRTKVFSDEASKNLEDIIAQTKKLIPEDIKQKKGSKTVKNEDSDDDKEETSKGYISLKSKIHQRCKHLKEGRLETECKTKEFVRLLKADKKTAKKKDKDGNKKERFITDGDAETYFNEEIHDGLKDMLTHKFDIKSAESIEGFSVLDQHLELRSIKEDLLNEKREAREDRTAAKNLIKSLLRDIDGEYSDTRKAVSSLYKDSLDEQKRDALESLTSRDEYAKAKDYPKAQAALASFLENFGLLRTLDTELYSTTNDSLSFARRNGLIENDPLREITRDMSSFRFDLLNKFINNPRILEMGVNSLDSALAGVTNCARGMRGNVNCGAADSSAAALVKALSGTRTGRGQ